MFSGFLLDLYRFTRRITYPISDSKKFKWKSKTITRPNGSIAVMYCKVSQRYLIKSSCKKKNIDWDIQKIQIFYG
jgi:hypothetical protein